MISVPGIYQRGNIYQVIYQVLLLLYSRYDLILDGIIHDALTRQKTAIYHNGGVVYTWQLVVGDVVAGVAFGARDQQCATVTHDTLP